MNRKHSLLSFATVLCCQIFITLPALAEFPPGWTKELIKLKNLGTATQHYQAEYGASTWPRFEQLLSFGGDHVRKQFGTFVDPKSGKSEAWLYMPEGAPTGGERIILIAAPLPRPADTHSKGKEWRAILWSDFTAEFFDEAEFQKRIKQAKLEKRVQKGSMCRRGQSVHMCPEKRKRVSPCICAK